MPPWKPEEIWKNQDVFVIGGGDSLRTFDWDLLKHELTIGCNNAYTFGAEICNVCIFGDIKWFRHHKEELLSYKGAVFSSCPQLQRSSIPWIWTMMRKSIGFHKDALGWCGNIGASAINLSLLLGAKNTFLLGFDMHLSKDGNNNWHDNPLDKPENINHSQQLKQMSNLDKYLENKFPGRQVINVTRDSSLNVFPKVDFELFFKERTKKK
jgi:hypothetical protein